MKSIIRIGLCMLIGGCVNATVTQSSGGGGSDASSCITVSNPDAESGNSSDDALVENRCNVTVNFLEFSTGSQGLVTIGAMTTIRLNGFIFAWGACAAPSMPERLDELDFQCVI
ncbi:MAG: hypothetical protein KTR18_16130 [Acidiferrobacterales bacterium]|nr:hypothetical protein [Acidiferrobacterales bacterium]